MVIKKIKLLSIMAIVMSCNLQGVMDLKSVTIGMSKENFLILLSAVGLGIVADFYSQRDFDDKGNYTTTGGEEDSAVSDLGFSAAYGTGLTWFENIKDGKNPSLDVNVKQSFLNTLCFWLTKQVTRKDLYKNLNRNSFLLRWVPISVKVDDGAKQLALLAIFRSLLTPVIMAEQAVYV
jgi:hypothetical protein